MSAKAIFLDKDGTLIEDIPYNVDPDRIRLSAGAVEGLRLLQSAGYQLIVVSNQSGVARGYFEENSLKRVKSKLQELLSSEGVRLTDFYYCPHHPSGTVGKYATECFCRKPQPGMIFRAAFEHNICLTDSWLVGDTLQDIEAGNRAGCQTVWINSQAESDWLLPSIRKPAFIAKDLLEAAKIISRKICITGSGVY